MASGLRRRGLPAALGLAFLALGAARATEAAPQFLTPGAGEALAPGAIVEVRWPPSLCAPHSELGEGREIDEAEIVLSLDGGRTFPIRVTPELSPCASRFLWKVPALATAHARLALRAGADDRSETESIEILSAEFRILADPDGRVEQLRRHVAEWWTPVDPGWLGTEGFLERTMGAGREEISLPTGLPEAGAPTPFAGAVRPEHAFSTLDPENAPVQAASSRSLRARIASLTPLRL